MKNQELVSQLKKILTTEEFKTVTEFCSIYTGDNEISIEDDCSGDVENLKSFDTMLINLYIDNVGDCELKDLQDPKFQRQLLILAQARRQIWYASENLL